MARGAANVSMCTLQRELRARLMVEQRRFPFGGVVALRAAWVRAVPRKLVCVDVFVAPFAPPRRRFEDYVPHGQLKIRRLVATPARDAAMTSHQVECRGGMIEAGNLRPSLCGMAGLASDGNPLRSCFLHPLGELAAVGIFMAARTGEIAEAVRDRESSAQGLLRLMAIAAGHGHVSAGQREARPPMPIEGKGGGSKAFDRMAAFTAVVVRRTRKLPLMNVRMAIRAMAVFDLVERFQPGRQMAFGTGNCGMPALQRIRGCGVIRHSEFR